MTDTIKQAPKTEAPKAGPKTEEPKSAPKGTPKPTGYIFDQPGPMFKYPNRPSINFFKPLMTASAVLTRLLLVATVLSAFAKKETQNGQATLTAGALGMTFMKTTIREGNPKSDFDGKMILTETANEITRKIAPKLTTEPLFNKNPIQNGAFDQFAKSLLDRD